MAPRNSDAISAAAPALPIASTIATRNTADAAPATQIGTVKMPIGAFMPGIFNPRSYRTLNPLASMASCYYAATESRWPPPRYDFPSSRSIPPVNIMAPEPPEPRQPAAASDAQTPAPGAANGRPATTPLPPRRPHRRGRQAAGGLIR